VAGVICSLPRTCKCCMGVAGVAGVAGVICSLPGTCKCCMMEVAAVGRSSLFQSSFSSQPG
jgi:hypothetical protein